MNDTTLPSNNPLRFRKNLLQKKTVSKKMKTIDKNFRKIKLNTIQTDKFLIFWLYDQEMLVNMNF